MWSMIIINSEVVQQDNAFEGLCITNSNDSEKKLNIEHNSTSYAAIIKSHLGR